MNNLLKTIREIERSFEERWRGDSKNGRVGLLAIILTADGDGGVCKIIQSHLRKSQIKLLEAVVEMVVCPYHRKDEHPNSTAILDCEICQSNKKLTTHIKDTINQLKKNSTNN